MAAHSNQRSNNPTHLRQMELRHQLTSYRSILADLHVAQEQEESILRDTQQRAAQALHIAILETRVEANAVLAAINQERYKRLEHYQQTTQLYQKWWWPILFFLATLVGSMLPNMSILALRDNQRRRSMPTEYERNLQSQHQTLVRRLDYLEARRTDPVTLEVRLAREKVISAHRQVNSVEAQIQRIEIQLASLERTRTQRL